MSFRARCLELGVGIRQLEGVDNGHLLQKGWQDGREAIGCDAGEHGAFFVAEGECQGNLAVCPASFHAPGTPASVG